MLQDSRKYLRKVEKRLQLVHGKMYKLRKQSSESGNVAEEMLNLWAKVSRLEQHLEEKISFFKQ